jgi:hypothetical protein
MSLSDAENKHAIEITKHAYDAELSSNFKHACDLYAEASSLFKRVIGRAAKKSEERRFAKLNLRASSERLSVLRRCMQDKGPSVPSPLPSLTTIEEEIRNPAPGTVLLSLVSRKSWHVPRDTRHLLPQVEMGQSSTLQVSPGLNQRRSSSANEFLTDLLSPSLPEVTYHVCCDYVRRWVGDSWIYIHIKDDKRATLYTFLAPKRPQDQITLITMFRATDYISTCATITVAPIIPLDSDTESAKIGRTLRIYTGTQKVVAEVPDLIGNGWTPRRFTYGGLRFVWKERKGSSDFVENLYEVLKEWPDPSSSQGKRLDHTHLRRLVWVEAKPVGEEDCSIHMVGGLDQMFREFLLASQVSRLFTGFYGHI